MRRLDKLDRIEIVAAQAHGVRDRTGVSVAESEAAAWIVAAGDVKVGGARAIGLALAIGRGARWPTVAWKVPGIPALLDAIYRVVATNRRRLPGDTPWCVVHDEACEPRND